MNPLWMVAAVVAAGELPLHPLCVHDVVSSNSTARADLSECGAEPPTVDGNVVHYAWPNDGLFGRPPFTEYAVVAHLGQRQLIRYVWSGGGTGYFSGLVEVEENGRYLERKRALTGGDRCNGGLVDASATDDAVDYSVNVTPIDILELSPHGKALGLAAYHDLEASAQSCFAHAHFRFDASSGTTTLSKVALHDTKVADAAHWTAKFVHQGCFNVVYNTHLAEELTPTKLDAFAAEFARVCLGR